MDINREGQLVESLHQDQVASVAGLRSVEGIWVEKCGRRRIDLVFALLVIVLLGIVLVVFVDCVREEIVGGVFDQIALTINVAGWLVSVGLIIGQEVVAEGVVSAINVISVKRGHGFIRSR